MTIPSSKRRQNSSWNCDFWNPDVVSRNLYAFPEVLSTGSEKVGFKNLKIKGSQVELFYSDWKNHCKHCMHLVSRTQDHESILLHFYNVAVLIQSFAMCQLYSYCLPDPVHRGAEGLVLLKLNCPRRPFMVFCFVGFFLFILKPHKQKKVIEEFLNSVVPDANAMC